MQSHMHALIASRHPKMGIQMFSYVQLASAARSATSGVADDVLHRQLGLQTRSATISLMAVLCSGTDHRLLGLTMNTWWSWSPTYMIST